MSSTMLGSKRPWGTHFVGFTVSALMLAWWTSSASAMDIATRSRARDLVNDGVADFEAGQFEPARTKFMDAYALAQAPTVVVWAARANDKLGRLLEAASLYRIALTMQPNELWSGQVQQKAQKDAETALSALEPRIPFLRVELSKTNESNLEVFIDEARAPYTGAAIERQVDPGSHLIIARKGDRIVARQSVVLAEAEKRSVQLQLPNESAPANASIGIATIKAGQVRPHPSSSPANEPSVSTLTWVALGAGAAGLTLGTIAGILTELKHSELQDNGCTDTTCRGSQFDDRVNSHNTWRTISTASFIVGGIGAAAGVALFLTKPAKEPRVGIAIRPSGIAVRGAF